MYWQSLWFRSPAADQSARGIFHLVAIAAKAQCDQGELIEHRLRANASMNRRKRKPPAGIAIRNEAQAWPKENANQAAVHNVTSGNAVIINSATLRT